MDNEDVVVYLTDIAERLECLCGFLAYSVHIANRSRYADFLKVKYMVDSIICDELTAMAGTIFDDIKGEE